MNESGRFDELEIFEKEIMAALELSITQDPEKLPIRAPLQRVGETGTLLMYVSRLDPIKLTKLWPQHRAVCDVSTAHV
jgi:hypothetical protein